MIGFLGGSFDPVHFGHLKGARSVKKELNLDKLFLMPCKSPVHKDTLFFSNQQRLDMLDLALDEFNDLSLDTREIYDKKPSYSIYSLKSIKQQYPNKQIFFILGEDSFATFATWKDHQQFAKYAQIVVLPRSNQDKSPGNNQNIYFAKTQLVNVSSTQIRSKIRNQQSLSGLLPKRIIEYIQQL